MGMIGFSFASGEKEEKNMIKEERILERLYEITGYRFRMRLLPVQAFTRKSYPDGENCEILEMYGDAILGNCAMQIVHERYGFFRMEGNAFYAGEPGYAIRGIRNEGALHELKKKMVCNATLARQIDKWDLAQYLWVGREDELNHAKEQEKTKADLFEAIIGAIAVDCDFKEDICKEVVKRMLPLDEIFAEIETQMFCLVDFDIDNAIMVLKELAEKGMISMPEYDFSGPEYLEYLPNGDPRWSCKCEVASHLAWKLVFANSKRTAKKMASYLVLCHIFERTDEYIKAAAPLKIVIGKNGEYSVEDDPIKTQGKNE